MIHLFNFRGIPGLRSRVESSFYDLWLKYARFSGLCYTGQNKREESLWRSNQPHSGSRLNSCP